MKYFFDTEFIEDGRTIDLVSIGIVAEDGREYYAVSTDADLTKASPWVREHVLPQLPRYGNKVWKSREDIRLDMVREYDGLPFVQGVRGIEFWAYFADYDWVAFCQLFGRMIDLPDHFPKYCHDLKQEMHRLGVSKDQLPEQVGAEHDALEDARWVRDSYLWISKNKERA